MSALGAVVERAVDRFNRASIWRGRTTVWEQQMHSATFERWLYLKLHRLGWMGQDEQKTLRRWVRPGMTVVDIGANLGLYSVLLSTLVGKSGRVFSFEPDPELAGLLATSARVNGCDNVVARAMALGERAAEITLQRGMLNSGDNYLGASEKRSFRQLVQIPVAALDEIEPNLQADFIKLDVQGWELPVLRGMEKTLTRNPALVLQVEFWPGGCRRAGYEPTELVRFLHDHHFAIGTSDRPDEVLSAEGLLTLERRLTGMRHADLIVRRISAGSSPLRR